MKLRSLGIIAVASLVLLGAAVTSADAGPVGPGIWYEFSFGAPVGPAAGCSPADPGGPVCTPSGGTPTVFADAPPWTFAAPASGAILTVTDAFIKTDSFSVLDFGATIGVTSPPAGSGSCGSDPVPCLADPGASKGFFPMAPGAHSITFVNLTGTPGAAYFKWDPGVSTPTPGALGLALIGISLGLLRRRRGQ